MPLPEYKLNIDISPIDFSELLDNSDDSKYKSPLGTNAAVPGDAGYHLAASVQRARDLTDGPDPARKEAEMARQAQINHSLFSDIVDAPPPVPDKTSSVMPVIPPRKALGEYSNLPLIHTSLAVSNSEPSKNVSPLSVPPLPPRKPRSVRKKSANDISFGRNLPADQSMQSSSGMASLEKRLEDLYNSNHAQLETSTNDYEPNTLTRSSIANIISSPNLRTSSHSVHRAGIVSPNAGTSASKFDRFGSTGSGQLGSSQSHSELSEPSPLSPRSPRSPRSPGFKMLLTKLMPNREQTLATPARREVLSGVPLPAFGCPLQMLDTMPVSFVSFCVDFLDGNCAFSLT